MVGTRTVLLALAAIFALGACGGTDATGAVPLTRGPTFTGRIVATKSSTGQVFRMARTGSIYHLAYGINGLVTINAANFLTPKIVRRTDTVIADDVTACSGLLYVLTYLAPPTLSKVTVFDAASDPQLPQRLGEVRLVLAPGARIGCRGRQVFVGGGASGLHIINAANPRLPTVTKPDAGTPGSAIGFHSMVVTGFDVRLVTDMGGLPQRTEVVFTGDGVTTDFPTAGQTFLSFPPVTPGSISLSDGVETFTDQSASASGSLTGDLGGSGSVDYVTGEVTLSFTTAPAPGSDVVASYNPPTPVCLTGAAIPANCATSGNINCFGKFGIRSLRLNNPQQPTCSPLWTDFRVPETADLDFPPSTGVNTSSVNHPIAVAENAGRIYVASTRGRRLTIATNAGSVLFSGDLPGIPAGEISDLAVADDLMVLVDGDVRIVDVSDPQAPFLSSTVPTPGTAFQVLLTRLNANLAYAFVADGNNGFTVIEIRRTFFTPVAPTLVAREVPAAAGIAVVPSFEEVSPLSSSSAIAASGADEGALHEGRLLVTTIRNLADAPGSPTGPPVDSAIAEGVVGGSLLSISDTGFYTIADPGVSRMSLLGPYPVTRERVRVYSQNSVCSFGSDTGVLFPLDPVCELSVANGAQLDGRFFAFAGADPASLPATTYSLFDALSDITIATHPAPPVPALNRGEPWASGLPEVQLVPVGSSISTIDVQTGGHVMGGAPRGLTPMANPIALAISRDGFVLSASSGILATANAAGAVTPFSLSIRPGRVTLHDEFGAPYTYRRLDSNTPFDLQDFNDAVASGSLAAALAASPLPVIPPYQLRDGSGMLIDIPGCDSPPCPRTPDRPPTGVYYADEQSRSQYLLPTETLQIALARTSNRPINSMTSMPSLVPCATVDSNPYVINPNAPPHLDERTSLGLCHGVFGLAYAGSGVDRSQADDPLTPDFDYYTRNPTYFATTGDGGVVLIDLDSGISQVSPPGTLGILAGGPDVACEPFLSDVLDRDVNFPGATGTPLECDAFLRMGMTYVPQKETLFVANPVGGSVTAISLTLAGAGTPAGVKYQEGALDFTLGGLLRIPVDIVPSRPLLLSTSQGATSSDLFVLDRGTGAVVRMSQSGEFLAIAEPRAFGRPIGVGRFAGMTISPGGESLYITLSEDCASVLGGSFTSTSGCVIRIPTFGD